MFRLMRFILTSCFIVGLLSLTYENRPLFFFVYKYSKTIVGPAQESTKELFRVGYMRSLDFSRQFFNNNLPVKDSLDFQLSAPDRESGEGYSEEDEKELNDIFGN